MSSNGHSNDDTRDETLMMILHSTCARGLLGAVLSSAAIAGIATAEERPVQEHLQLLEKNGIATDTDGILDYLDRLQPDARVWDEIAALVGQLSSSEFSEREAATSKLPTFGPPARPLLEKAALSKDAEVVWRAEKILGEVDSGRDMELRRSLVLAALHVLRARGQARATPVLFDTLAALDDAAMCDVASEAIWASIDQTHAMLPFKKLASENVRIGAASIVALEIAAGEEAVQYVSPYLKNESALLRLAAARALADRQPQDAIAVLVELSGNKDDEVAWQADALLQLLAGKQIEPAEDHTLAQAWRTWRNEELPTAKLKNPLGAKRFDLSAGRNLLEESFARAAKNVADGYGRFIYEADNQGTASVADGRLLIDGENPEGDQRLYITSQRMIGRDAWPKNVQVRAKLGGKEGNNFGWHMGVSVGRVKVLFHPGLGGGAFRAETTDEHDYLFGNETMAFTPANDVIHELTIDVVRTETGADFEVALHDSAGDAMHRKKFSATAEQLGAFNRIGLERSGRTGAAAMFDSVSIRLGR